MAISDVASSVGSGGADTSQGTHPGVVERPVPRIALVAVHGVADQAPCASARQIASLLVRRTRSDGQPQYSSFREVSLFLPVSPAGSVRTPSLPADPADLIFTHQLLQGHEKNGPSEAHATLRLEGHRLSGGEQATDEADVHVYEYYWADLSRLSTRVSGIVNASAQLISSLAILGLGALERALGDTHPKSIKCHTTAVWLLTVFIPWVNLALISLAAAVPLSAAPRGLHVVVVSLVVQVIAHLTVRAVWRRHSRDPERPPAPSGYIFVHSFIAILAAPLSYYLSQAGESLPSLSLLCLFLGIILVFRSLALAHANRRPLVGQLAFLLLLGLAHTYGGAFQLAGDRVLLADWVISAFEFYFFAMQVGWLSLFLLAAIALVGVRKSRSRAVSTAAGTLAVSLATVSVAVVLLWAAVAAMVTRTLPQWRVGTPLADSTYAPSSAQRPIVRLRGGSYSYTPRFRYVTLARDDTSHSRHTAADSTTATEDSTHLPVDQVCFSGDQRPVERYRVCQRFSQESLPRFMMSTSTAYGLFAPLLFLVVCLLVLLIALGPSILREVRPGRLGAGKAAFERSSALGLWLTRGLTLLRQTAARGGVGVVVVNLLVMGAGLALLMAPMVYPWSALLDGLRYPADRISGGIGAIVTASTLGLAVALSRIQGVARSVRPALDVMLDVDNYLRTKPEDGPPRALMFARFASLVRYLTRWHREGKNYDAIVFVAHSQGSMIVLEALRYHRKVGFTGVDPDLAGIPQYLMTMGSPVVQLYSRAFPTLYEWTSRELSADALRLAAWINIYRSGDYVGRSLWHAPDDPSTYEDLGRCTPCGCESCLGEGAHVHYWDRYASDVALALDRLVTHAASRA